MRATLSIPDPLFVSSPNGGGVLFLHEYLLMPLVAEDVSGLTSTADGLLWCVQTNGGRSLRKVGDGRVHAISVSDSPADLHDLLTTVDGTFAVFTDSNQVVRLDANYSVVESWCFGDEPDSAHVNCLAMHNGRLVVSMFGRFAAHWGYKGATRQAGLVVDVRTGQPLIEGLSQPHSLVSIGEELWLCNSEDQTVRVYGADYQLKRTVALPGYTRGLAVGREHLYVGLSRSRNAFGSDVGEFDSAAIAVLDFSTLEVIGYVPIPYGEIYDICVAPPAFNTPNIMASLWTHERVQQEALNDEEACVRERVRSGYQLAQAAAARELEQVRAGQQLAQEEAARAFDEKLAAHQMLQADATRQIEQLRVELLQSVADVEKRDALIDELERQFHRMSTSRSWRWTWPIRAGISLLRGQGFGGKEHQIVATELQQQLMNLRQQIMVAPNPAESLVVPLESVENSKRDVFIWSVTDWRDGIQRPQHLARELANRGHRVFYISNNFLARSDVGFSIESLNNDGRLFIIQLYLEDNPAACDAMPSPAVQEQLSASIGKLLAWTGSRSCLSLLEHPFWTHSARILPNHRLVYDCVDNRAGSAENSVAVLASELDLMHAADLLVVTSDWLYSETAKYNSSRLMVRNACQYEHFAIQPKKVFEDKRNRRVIGYYGAIAEWVDLDLLEKVARQFSDCLMLMVGGDSAGARQRLCHLDNVEFTGEVPYTMRPFYLAGFDVCMLPFQVTPPTFANNPVTIYEYLSAGKDVVSIALPEIRQFGDLVHTGIDHASFIEAMRVVLSTPPDAATIAARQQFAAEQTWAHRVHELMEGIDALPLTSSRVGDNS